MHVTSFSRQLTAKSGPEVKSEKDVDNFIRSILLNKFTGNRNLRENTDQMFRILFQKCSKYTVLHY